MEINTEPVDGPTERRDLVGYGQEPLAPDWPGGARIAVQFVINYEEGGERSLVNGDEESEAFLSDATTAVPLRGRRNLTVESLYEYGSRVGFWRLRELFTQRGLPTTVFAVGLALEQHPEAGAAMVEAGFEVASHGYRWIDYQDVPLEVEREHIRQSVTAIERACGVAPVGWYTGRTGPNTRRLVVEHGGFLYDADSYADDLPYWVDVEGTSHLVVPYTLDNNDMRFVTTPGFATGREFGSYLCDAFDVLYAEGAERPRMISIGLHCRLAGRPGRAGAVATFLDHVQSHDEIWICSRADIARHWLRRFPAQ